MLTRLRGTHRFMGRLSSPLTVRSDTNNMSRVTGTQQLVLPLIHLSTCMLIIPVSNSMSALGAFMVIQYLQIQ